MHSRRVIFDALYGFIPVTVWEEKIINSPFFQRLRWIKQLGFANYIFPGAEHNRFGHVIGVMHCMHRCLHALGIAVSDEELFDPVTRTSAAKLHKSARIAALLHDIGTFPFSHSIEFAYLRHGNDPRRFDERTRSAKDLPNSHEHLGSFIIKNTNYPGGLTEILRHYDLDVQLISHIIKGESEIHIANQLMHSDLDADRMDYLIRDAHYTGIRYGHFDKEYLLANLTLFDAGQGQQGFGIQEHAIPAVEHFLMARYSWYAQVIKNPGTAKFDIMAAYLAQALLQEDLIFQFHDLLTLIDEQDERFFWWNDVYFMSKLFELRQQGKLKDPRVAEAADMLLYRRSPKQVDHPLFRHTHFDPEKDGEARKKRVEDIHQWVQEAQHVIRTKGHGREWILADLPAKDVVLTKSIGAMAPEDALQLRDPIKIVTKTGKAGLLVEHEHTLIKLFAKTQQFIPSLYANASAYELLANEGLIPRS